MDEEIKACPNIEPHENTSNDDVKSKAIQLYSHVQPVQFNKLRCNTNLNLPPSNWLTSSSPISYNLHQALYNSPGFASFRLAHMFPESLGDVEVVSDAENIKKLLKLSYSAKSVISMMVHRVGNTLLIDEFDIQKYLLRKYDEDWKWLRKFIIDNIIKSIGDNERKFYSIKDKSREALQSKNLLSKFLYYSLGQSPNENLEECGSFRPLQLSSAGPVLPEPKIEENIPDPKSARYVHNRNVIWTFEDIRMLIGTDMPIFGGPNRPCISLRLRDMNKPINVLTGIDYWLDNLMCNVPEVVMCYHLDGLVQKYELIKTEDLPYLEDSQFSPQVVKNVAQNILAFLKAKATKAGHTYWLFKGRNDDVVKLYDLTTLCENRKNSADADDKSGKQTEEEEEEEESEKETSKNNPNDNPFTVPVAMLLYTVARNMKNTIPNEEMTAKKAGSIRALLDNCIKLLPKEKYPQIVTSSYYILSELYIPSGIDPKNPRFYSGEEADSDFDDNGSEFDDYNDEDSFCDDEQVSVQSICETLKRFNSVENTSLKTKPMPLVAGTEERCTSALMCISSGLNALKFFNSNEEKFLKESEKRAKEEKKRRIIHEEQNPIMAKPFQPIPLPYEKLESAKETNPNATVPTKICKKKKGKDCEEDSNLKGVQILDSKSFGSWNVHLKLLLLEKACLVYKTLMEYNFNNENYGTSLKCIHIAFKCHEVVFKYMNKMTSQKGCLLGRAGDCLFKIFASEKHDAQLQQFSEENESDLAILEEVEAEIEELSCLIKPTNNIEHLLLASCRSYEDALKYISDSQRIEVFRRLGNVRNELGLKYMHWAQDEYEKFLQSPNECDDPLYKDLILKSFDSLIRGIKAFEEINDLVNLAFLRCNLGRFYRLRAHVQMPKEDPDDFKRIKRFYQEAFRSYEQAKLDLESRKSSPDLWDLVDWELSTATFNIAKQMQDSTLKESANNIEEIKKEVLDLLQKALKMCDYENSKNPRQILYTYRAGIIHGRIASFQHNQVRHATNKRILKTSIQLSQLHYEKATNILESLNESTDYLRIQLENIGLEEFLAENSKSPANKLHHLQSALILCSKSSLIFEHISNSKINLCEEVVDLMKLFSSRLQAILKNIFKLVLSGKELQKYSNVYKYLYTKSLSISTEDDDKIFAATVTKILKEIKTIVKDENFNKL